MRKVSFFLTLAVVFVSQHLFAAVDVAPVVPDLELPTEENVLEGSQIPTVLTEAPAEVKPEVAPVAAPKKTSSKKKKKSAAKTTQTVPPVTKAAAKVNEENIAVENLLPATTGETLASSTVVAEPVAVASATEKVEEKFEPARETNPELAQEPEKKEIKVLFNPPTDRDPTLSVDDTLLLKHREEERLRAIEAERQRKIEEERQRLAEIERQRQLELERLRDPSREIRGKIRINGIIGQEVFIGDRVYGVGSTVLGARIVQVLPESVVFTYKGQKFTKKVQLK